MAGCNDAKRSGDLPQLSARSTQSLLLQCADVTLRLSADLTVEHVYCAKKVEGGPFQRWCGQSFGAIVAADSQPKIPLLLEDNAALGVAEGRWRHLNLTGDSKEIPLLLKCFRFAEGDDEVLLLCGRDLRPMVDVQAEFSCQLASLERKIRVLEAEAQKG